MQKTNLIKCKKCKNMVDDDSLFCKYCGKKIKKNHKKKQVEKNIASQTIVQEETKAEQERSSIQKTPTNPITETNRVIEVNKEETHVKETFDCEFYTADSGNPKSYIVTLHKNMTYQELYELTARTFGIPFLKVKDILYVEASSKDIIVTIFDYEEKRYKKIDTKYFYEGNKIIVEVETRWLDDDSYSSRRYTPVSPRDMICLYGCPTSKETLEKRNKNYNTKKETKSF